MGTYHLDSTIVDPWGHPSLKKRQSKIKFKTAAKW